MTCGKNLMVNSVEQLTQYSAHSQCLTALIIIITTFMSRLNWCLILEFQNVLILVFY